MVSIVTLGLIADNVYEDTTVGVHDWKRSNYVSPLKDARSGFFGALYWRPSTRSAVVAFRGTEFKSDPKDLLADAQIAANRMPLNQVAQAFAYTKKCSDFVRGQNAAEFVIVGHSLGGGLAAVVAANFGGAIGITFNAPGMRKLSGMRLGWGNEKRVANIRASTDLVSRKGDHVGQKPRAVFVSMNPLTAHKITEVIEKLVTHPLGRRRPQELVPG